MRKIIERDQRRLASAKTPLFPPLDRMSFEESPDSSELIDLVRSDSFVMGGVREREREREMEMENENENGMEERKGGVSSLRTEKSFSKAANDPRVLPPSSTSSSSSFLFSSSSSSSSSAVSGALSADRDAAGILAELSQLTSRFSLPPPRPWGDGVGMGDDIEGGFSLKGNLECLLGEGRVGVSDGAGEGAEENDDEFDMETESEEEEMGVSESEGKGGREGGDFAGEEGGGGGKDGFSDESGEELGSEFEYEEVSEEEEGEEEGEEMEEEGEEEGVYKAIRRTLTANGGEKDGGWGEEERGEEKEEERERKERGGNDLERKEESHGIWGEDDAEASEENVNWKRADSQEIMHLSQKILREKESTKRTRRIFQLSQSIFDFDDKNMTLSPRRSQITRDASDIEEISHILSYGSTVHPTDTGVMVGHSAPPTPFYPSAPPTSSISSASPSPLSSRWNDVLRRIVSPSPSPAAYSDAAAARLPFSLPFNQTDTTLTSFSPLHSANFISSSHTATTLSLSLSSPSPSLGLSPTPTLTPSFLLSQSQPYPPSPPLLLLPLHPKKFRKWMGKAHLRRRVTKRVDCKPLRGVYRREGVGLDQRFGFRWMKRERVGRKGGRRRKREEKRVEEMKKEGLQRGRGERKRVRKECKTAPLPPLGKAGAPPPFPLTPSPTSTPKA